MAHRKHWLLVPALLLFIGCQAKITNHDSKGTSIVCFGDSITAGYGADTGQDYPSILKGKVALPVINAGVPGDTTATALRRLDSDVLAHNPKIVIITLGGNDFLQHVPKSETLKNMEAIINQIQAHGAMVVWATVKTGFFSDGYAKDFEQMAKTKHVLLVADILKDILFNPQYKYDNIHPNSAGYKIMAERIYKAIQGF